MADDYAARLLDTGHRQFQLIGYCLGGLIAVETAGRLLEPGTGGCRLGAGRQAILFFIPLKMN
ncbi:thioesterase domain-containing protein [Paenibacillus sp. 2KB_20]|uniref:thioesterase domain-containing protein n=1 Tax=Paenibacillus TaxID=44249 RepID=UPI003D2BD797